MLLDECFIASRLSGFSKFHAEPSRLLKAFHQVMPIDIHQEINRMLCEMRTRATYD
jgi:hypothetical protein